ncbi:MAG: ATP-binding protein [bacterium]
MDVAVRRYIGKTFEGGEIGGDPAEMEARISSLMAQNRALSEINSLLEEKLFRATVVQEVEGLFETARDIDDVVGGIASLLRKMVDYDVGAILVVEAKNGRVYLSEPLSRSVANDIKNRISDLWNVYGAPISHWEIDFIGGEGRESGEETGRAVSTFLGFPIAVRGQAIGMVCLISFGRESFSGEEVRVLKIIADHIGLLVDNTLVNARVRRLLDERESMLYMLNEAGKLMGSIVHFDRLLSMIVDLCLSVTGADVGSIMLFDGGRLDTTVSYGLEDRIVKSLRMKTGEAIVELVGSGEPFISRDVSADDRIDYSARDVFIKSFLSVPLKTQEEIVGVVNVVNAPEDFLDDEERLDTLYTMVGLAAVTVKNARLYDELKTTRDQLIQSEKLASLGEMAAGIVHEIRNPLTAIRGFADMIYKSLSEGQYAGGLEFARVVVDEVDRLNGIVQDILSFARRSEPSTYPTDLNELVSEVLVLIRKMASYNKVKIVARLNPEPVIAMVEASQIKQVFLNIMQNAIQAMPGGGTLTISSSIKDGVAEVGFADTGVGIEPDKINKIFDPFFTTKKDGTGLGMSVSFRIVENHRGRIEVKSRVGEGTTFTVKLPVNPANLYDPKASVGAAGNRA